MEHTCSAYGLGYLNHMACATCGNGYGKSVLAAKERVIRCTLATCHAYNGGEMQRAHLRRRTRSQVSGTSTCFPFYGRRFATAFRASGSSGSLLRARHSNIASGGIGGPSYVIACGSKLIKYKIASGIVGTGGGASDEDDGGGVSRAPLRGAS